MKVGFEAKRAFFNRTGLGNYTRNLVKGLHQYYPEDRFYLFSPPDGPIHKDEILFSERVKEIGPESSWGKFFPSLWRSFGLTNDLVKYPLDLFHGTSHELPWNVDKLKIPTVVTIHDLIFMRYPEQFSWIDGQIYKKKFAYSARKSFKVVAISEQTKTDIQEFLGIDAKKIEVLYQSCDDSFYTKVTEETKSRIRQEYGLPQEFILFVGSLIERKNALTILKSLKILKEKLSVPCVLVGSGGDYQKKLYRYVKENHLEGDVFFLHQVPFQKLPALYQMATIFVYPSIFEGFGIPIAEALASDIPAITSRTSCFHEVGGPQSLYVDPMDHEEMAFCIERLLTHTELQEEMITQGKTFRMKFDHQKTTQKVHEFYKNIIKDYK